MTLSSVNPPSPVTSIMPSVLFKTVLLTAKTRWPTSYNSTTTRPMLYYLIRPESEKTPPFQNLFVKLLLHSLILLEISVWFLNICPMSTWFATWLPWTSSYQYTTLLLMPPRFLLSPLFSLKLTTVTLFWSAFLRLQNCAAHLVQL